MIIVFSNKKGHIYSTTPVISIFILWRYKRPFQLWLICSTSFVNSLISVWTITFYNKGKLPTLQFLIKCIIVSPQFFVNSQFHFIRYFSILKSFSMHIISFVFILQFILCIFVPIIYVFVVFFRIISSFFFEFFISFTNCVFFFICSTFSENKSEVPFQFKSSYISFIHFSEKKTRDAREIFFLSSVQSNHLFEQDQCHQKRDYLCLYMYSETYVSNHDAKY